VQRARRRRRLGLILVNEAHQLRGVQIRRPWDHSHMLQVAGSIEEGMAVLALALCMAGDTPVPGSSFRPRRECCRCAITTPCYDSLPARTVMKPRRIRSKYS
jgi:hypothetical protein